MNQRPLLELLERLADEVTIPLDSEEATKQGIILPILGRVGWDRDNIREVVPEYRVENGRVDYCLRLESRSAVFVEAKRTDQELDRHQEQLLDYAFREGVEPAALTNGIIWWLYLPLLQGSWEQRKFFTIDISQQDPTDVADHFQTYLGRKEVAEGGAVSKAKALHESRAKERLTSRTLPRAWEQLLGEPDELLVELLAERVEGLCGHQPTPDQVASFLARMPQGKTIKDPPGAGQAKPKPSPTPVPRRERGGTGYTFQRPRGFEFQGQRQRATTWKEVLVGLSAEVAKREGPSFSRVTQLKGRKRDYFSQDYRSMTSPEAIPGTDLYVETNLSANDVVKRCREVLRMFGYDRSAFEVLTDLESG